MSNLRHMEGDSDEELKAKFVRVLAKAASDREFYEKLKADTEKTLVEEGITGGGFFIPIDKTILTGILRILDEMGGIICKKR